MRNEVKLTAEAGGIREYRLKANGLKVLLVENRVAPVVTVCVLYRVGSRNEAVGYTGSTHLLEHLLFKGTPTFNKTRNTQIAATLQKIGADFNATTWYDRTNYYETVPSDQLELAIRLEADRMRNSFIADEDRQSEMTVVRNELEMGQNEPLLVLDEAVYATAFREHPYHHPTIGWRADVENVPTARLKTFYDTFYHPNNATLIVVGDFAEEHALALVAEHFGAHPATDAPVPEVYTDEPQQQGERRVTIRRAGELALVQLAFHTPAVLGQLTVLSNAELASRAAAPPSAAAATNDIYPLVVLSAALSSGVTSRLYQALVERQLAVIVNTNCDQFRDPGLFNVYATVRPGVEPAEVERVILSELRRVAGEGLTETEVERARQQIVAQVAYHRDGTFNVAAQISEAEAVADWRFYQDYAANIERVTPLDVRRVAARYFTEDNRTIGHFIPKEANDEQTERDGDESSSQEQASAMREASEGIGGAGLDSAHPAAASAHGQLSLHETHALVPHHFKFYRDPETRLAGEPGRGQLKRQRDEATRGGGGGRPPLNSEPDAPAGVATADEQIIERAHGDKSSDAAAPNTPESAGGRSNFASRVARTQLGNGATLLALENRATPIVALCASLRAGSYFEPRERPGLAALTAEMLERGTLRRDKLQLAGDLEQVGAELDFSADVFAVNITGRALAKDLRLLLSTLAEELREPSFSAEELEKLKQQTVAAIREQQANTRFRAYERFSQLVFEPPNPFRLSSGEELIASIESITVADVRDFHERHYGGRALVVSLAGDVGGDGGEDVRQLFEDSFAGFTSSTALEIEVADPAPASGTRREVVVLKDKASVDILLGTAAPLRRAADDYYAAVLANSALGESTLSSRLGLQVRDAEGLTYGIGSRFRAPSLAAGPWYVAVSVNPHNVERAITSALTVLRDYVEHGVREEELADEKSAAIGSFKVSLSTNAGLARALWNAEFYGLGRDYLDCYPQLIQNVTRAEVNHAIRKYFRPDHLTIVIAGDYSA
ncbi:MAG: insulinase family protein [Pyrinomonadaceae bacterium]|nr:insulinase family protein [Pyrinomonadaceae bacterium]